MCIVIKSVKRHGKGRTQKQTQKVDVMTSNRVSPQVDALVKERSLCIWSLSQSEFSDTKLCVSSVTASPIRLPPGWPSVVPVLAALFCFFRLLRGFSTLVTAGVLRCLLTFLGSPSSVCERDVQQEPQQVSQSGEEGRLSHVRDQHDCGILTA